MTNRTVTLLDRDHLVIATAQVSARADHFGGLADLGPMPASLRQMFDEYEEIVEGQVLSLLDEIEESIAGLGLKAVLEGGREVAIQDLQIYPSTCRISFAVVEPAGADGPGPAKLSLKPTGAT